MKNKGSSMTKKVKHLKGPDIILNLKRIAVYGCDSQSSSTCCGSTGFHFECGTKAGYMEDPDMTGELDVLSVEKEKDCYLLKVKFRKGESTF